MSEKKLPLIKTPSLDLQSHLAELEANGLLVRIDHPINKGTELHQNTDAVMWSLAYRSNPIEDVHVEPYRSTGHSPKSGPSQLDSTMLIDATLKYPMAPLALPKREFMERAQELWKELGLPPITPHAPWPGYSLGDWNESWEQFAKNAVTGSWSKNGDETWLRRRSGLKPETPARTVETDDVGSASLSPTPPGAD